MSKLFLTLGPILAGLSVAAGAFASHALKEKLTEKALAIFETGAKYQMYHAIALVFVGILLTRSEVINETVLTFAGIAFIVGIALFSGSLYTLSLSGIKWLGAITPFGGVALILGWGCLAISAWNFK